MARSVAVVSAIYGGYDEIQEPPEQTVTADWFMFTDQGLSKDSMWNRRDLIARDPDSPRMAAKFPKCNGLVQFSPADVIVWLDGAARLSRPDSLEWLLDQAEYMPWTGFAHPDRDCIYDELMAASTQEKYHGQPMAEQVASYRLDGHPDHWGLWETGVIVRRRTALTVAVGEAWLREIERWSLQDQLSLPVVLRRYGLQPHTIPGNYWDHEYVHRTEHLVDA